jgi:PIN domain
VIVFDTTLLIILCEERTLAITDRNGKAVSRYRDRVQYLVKSLSDNNSIICIPTPVLAEFMVKAGAAGPELLKRFNDSSRFKLSPFDVRAAIEAAELIRKLKAEEPSLPVETWAKAKFDVQIVSIAKAEGVAVIYAEDPHLDAHGRRVGISVRRICDLPLPPQEEDDDGPNLFATLEESDT